MGIRTVNPSRNGDERIDMPLKQCFGKAIPVGGTKVGTQYVKCDNVNIFRQKDVYFCCHEEEESSISLSSYGSRNQTFFSQRPQQLLNGRVSMSAWLTAWENKQNGKGERTWERT